MMTTSAFPTPTDLAATLCLAIALIHSFSTASLHRRALGLPKTNPIRPFALLLSEIELVFGAWALVYLMVKALLAGKESAIAYIDSLSMTEPLFVFVIMTISASSPILYWTRKFVEKLSALLPLPPPTSRYLVTLTLGPLLGSFITEPAAMTITALLLRPFFQSIHAPGFRYGSLALLFVNISIGGVLTPFAAPAVVMVAKTWNWNLSHMWTHFGWKAILAVFANTCLGLLWFRKHLITVEPPRHDHGTQPSPSYGTSLAVWSALVAVILFSHHAKIFMGIFVLFLALSFTGSPRAERPRLRQALFVGFFLAGIVALGSPQKWWLIPLVEALGPFQLFVSSTTLTAITDNAALTYLGSLIPSMTLEGKYALVAGAIAGGGLTLMANAPNAIGYSILKPFLPHQDLEHKGLLAWAFFPTLIAASIFWLF